MIAEPSHAAYPHLAVTVDRPVVARFFLLLQQGVKIRRRIGCSVEVFLRQEIKAAPETIEKIQSIMLEGKPVDDIASSLVHDNATLALSAAMPGLVGATLRRGGAYSSLRSAITYHETEKPCTTGEGWVTVKIFNLLMAELGPDLLRTGVLLRSSDLLEFLRERAKDFNQGCSATVDKKPIDIALLSDARWLKDADQVFFTVAAGPAEA
jgi:hypothetical protein